MCPADCDSVGGVGRRRTAPRAWRSSYTHSSETGFVFVFLCARSRTVEWCTRTHGREPPGPITLPHRPQAYRMGSRE